MADKMYLVVTARKEVPDREAGRIVYEHIKQKLADRPDIELSGHVTNHYDVEQE
ncbi:hypothetical protein KAR91_35445 [Candidatus Pacearchaeota archaeon]|nr:hypothetical protein [Candidatus Pacearchaeota archaeon]